MQVTLYPLSDFSKPTPLAKAKAAFSFSIYTSVQHLPTNAPSSKSSGEFDRRIAVPIVITYLVVGCRRRMVVYSWRDGEPQEVSVSAIFASPSH